MENKTIVSNETARKRIEELEALLAHKRKYYARIVIEEAAMREGSRRAIEILSETRGSNSLEYLAERVEVAIKSLIDARDYGFNYTESEETKTTPSSVSNEDAYSRIEELEALVNDIDNCYKRMAYIEEELRAGVCEAIACLIQTRGSNSIEFMTEEIEDVIKILVDACDSSTCN